MRIKRTKVSLFLVFSVLLGVCLLIGSLKNAATVGARYGTGSGSDLVVSKGAPHKSTKSLPLPVPHALLGNLPLSFAENKGQLDARVAFHLQGHNTAAYFTAQNVTLAFTHNGAEKSVRAPGNARQRWNLKLDFVGANPEAILTGNELGKAQISYFNGTPEQWRTGIRSYSSITYRNLWPGIDLVYSGTTSRLKYEFIVNPGADPRQIKLAYRGTNAPLAVNQQKQLEIPTPFGVIHDDKPVSFQNKGKNKTKQIKTEFVVYERAADGSQAYGFKVGKYDKRKTLVIDPALLIYAGLIGGIGDDEGHSIAVDSAGNTYVTGVTTSAQATFPEVAGPDLTYNGRTDAFVAKIKADGSGLVYAGYIGGDGDDAGHSIAVDVNGNAYVTGWTASTQATFPVLGALDGTFNGAIDAFVAKINPSGTALSYCGYIGGDDEDEGLGIAVDAAGRAHVTGLTASSEATFPELVGPGLMFKGGVDAFVARIKADGSGLDYAGYLGGSGDDQGRSIAVDASGNVYVAGLTTSTEKSFLMTGSLGPVFNGATDAFIAKINSTGTAVTYSGFVGGSGIDEAYGIAVDASGSAYVTGRTTSTEATFPELVGPDLSFNGAIDAFVAKVNPAGSALDYAGYIGGSGDDEGFGIAVDSAGSAHVTGRTTSSEASFPKSNAFDLTLNGASDGFIAKVNPTGNALTYAGYLGGNGLEEGFGAAINGLRQVYVVGRTTSDTGFPLLVGPGLSFSGASDAFAMRIDDSSVACGAIAINPGNLPNGVMGTPYNQMLNGANGTAPYSFTIINGALPPNLELSTAGVISGTPIQSGSYNFTVMTTDVRGCTGIQAYLLVINSPCTEIIPGPPNLPNGFVGTLYNQPLSATGGTPSYTFRLDSGTLPTGVNIVGASLIGTPTATGIFSFTIKATDSLGCLGTRTYNNVVISGTGLQFYPLAHPVRLVDTRAMATACQTPGTPIPGGASLTVPARGVCDALTIPANAAAVTGNVTTVGPLANGFLTIYPSSAANPGVSNSNYQAGQTLNNVFTVGLGAADGAFKVFSAQTTDIVVDITGYFAPPGANGLFFHPLPTPVRLLDTRGMATACTTPETPLQAGLEFLQQGNAICSIPATALALVGNATTVGPLAQGFLTLFPADATRPLVASGNYRLGQTLNTPFTVGLSPSGQFKIYSLQQTNLVIDVLGYYSAEAWDGNRTGLLFSPMTPARLLDTRSGQMACFTPGIPIAATTDTLQAAGSTCTIPVTARAIVGNATTVSPAAGGFLTFWPSDATRPFVATSNFAAGVNFNRHYTVGLGTDGGFKIYALTSTHLVIDVSGSFAP